MSGGAGRASVLLVEDEPAQRELLAYNLKTAGFSVIEAENGEDALRLMEDEKPDLLVLDWMLPQVSGIEVCRRLRSRDATRGTPIIMLSAKSEEEDRVRGLDVGADDYVVKPYSVAEFVARVKTQLRRVRPSAAGQTLTFGNITLNAETHRVKRGGKLVKLGPKEFLLLATMMERPGRVWSREQLLHRAWGRGIFVDARTVDVYIGRLRKALGGDDPVRTVRGAGYALG